MFESSPEYELFLKAFAERKAPLTIFLGSGLSKPAGLPDWKTLERKLRKNVDDKMRESNEFQEKFKETDYNALKNSTDQWVTFKLIKNILGQPVFESLIENYLSVSDDEEIPPSYIDLMNLDPNGIVSLNLDRFAGEAVAASGRKFTSPIYGTELATKWNYQIERRNHLV